MTTNTPNAVLKWNGDRLLCNGVEIARVVHTGKRTHWLSAWNFATHGKPTTKKLARAAVEAHFGMGKRSCTG